LKPVSRYNGWCYERILCISCRKFFAPIDLRKIRTLTSTSDQR